MGADGWLGIGWPKEYGGQGRSPIEQFIFFDEAMHAGVLLPTLTINTVGADDHAVRHRGAEEGASCRGSSRGELHFAIGYTEPSAGTDLASLRTRAVRDGDEWVINGQKIYTSQAEYADYIWLAARTDPDAPKHKGISIFMVPTTSPGFKMHADLHRWAASAPTRPSTTTCACPPITLIGTENERLVADHHAAEPRARLAHDRRHGATLLEEVTALGAGDDASPTAGA